MFVGVFVSLFVSSHPATGRAGVRQAGVWRCARLATVALYDRFFQFFSVFDRLL